MATFILGISAYYHDSAAAIVCDGEIIAAAHEERFTRKKHDASFPEQAVRYVLSEAGIEFKDLSAVSFYDKPVLINGGKASLIDESYMNHLRNYKISLIDSGVKRKTEHFVNLFNEKLVNPEWKQKYIEEIVPLNNAMIDQYLKNETFDFVINWKKLSELSLHYYKEMIIPSIETNWNSLYNKNNYIKINGAGGGGFYIFLSENQSIELNGLQKMSISEF